MRIRLLAMLLLVCLLVPIGLASAADESPVYDVQIWFGADPSAPDRVVLIAGVELPAGTPLPAKVRVPLPEGAEVTWAGEILGSDVSADIPRETTVVAGTGGAAVELTLERSRNAQVESLWMPVTARDGRLSASLRWVQTEPADSVEFSVRMPPGAAQVEIEPPPPGAPQENPGGERLYTLASKPLKPGEAHVIVVSYAQGADGSQAAPGGPLSRDTLVAVLGGVVLLLAVMAGVILRRERVRASEGSGNLD